MSPIEEFSRRFGASYKWLATVTVMLSTIVTTAASTMINVALPDIMGALGMSQDQVQWLSTSFLASMTATMLLTAWALGRFGHRRALIGALTVFIAGSLLGAYSNREGEVILARVMQGVASGLIQPIAMVVMSEVFPREQRGRAMGIYTLGVVLAPALGPTVGGYLIDNYSWRYIFLALVPVCVAGIVAASVFMPERDMRRDGASLRFDAVGFAMLGTFLVCLLDGLSNGQRYGWGSFLIVGLLAAAVLMAVGFVVWELNCEAPLLNLRVFTYFRFSASCVVSLALGMGIYGSTYIVPLFVQLIQNYTPTRSGLLLMPAGFALALTSPISGHLSDRLPPWIPISTGLLLFGASCWLCGGADQNTPFMIFSFWIVLSRIGLGLITPSLNAGALRSLPMSLLAQGSGSVNFVRQLGGAIGVNVLSILIDRRMVFHGDALAQAITPDVRAASETIRRLGIVVAHWGNPFGDRLPMGAPPASMSYLNAEIIPKVKMFAYQDGFLIVAFVFLATIIPALFMRNGEKRVD